MPGKQESACALSRPERGGTRVQGSFASWDQRAAESQRLWDEAPGQQALYRQQAVRAREEWWQLRDATRAQNLLGSSR